MSVVATIGSEENGLSTGAQYITAPEVRRSGLETSGLLAISRWTKLE